MRAPASPEQIAFTEDMFLAIVAVLILATLARCLRKGASPTVVLVQVAPLLLAGGIIALFGLTFWVFVIGILVTGIPLMVREWGRS